MSEPGAAAPGPAISVVVPVLDEAAGIRGFLRELARKLGPADELIVVDGGSGDGTPARVAGLGLARLRLLEAPRGRGRQLEVGARAARGEWLLLLHADTWLPAAALAAIRGAGPAVRWGYFRVRVDHPAPAFRLIERGIELRSRAFDTPSGDQAIFVRRGELAAIGGVPGTPLMEDLLLADRLRRRSAPLRSRLRVATSARRWLAGGVLATVLRMWSLRLAFRLGAPPHRLAGRYRPVRGG